MKIEDNFLDQHEFDKIQQVMAGEEFPWFIRYRYYAGPPVSIEDTMDDHQFIHIFYEDSYPRSEFTLIASLLYLLQPVLIFRIRANLLPKLSNIVEPVWFHSDVDILSEEKQKHCTTSIFYMNTNNGYTIFEDGTKVESVANRLLTFPANMKHTGTSCTDQPNRIIINLNYFK